jgi:hypothetical protein
MEINLYNGLLRRHPAWKWLDLRELCIRLLPEGAKLNWVRYFTARVGSSASDPHQPQRQETYLRALRGECTPFSLHEGRFRTDTDSMPLVNSPPDNPELVKVRVTEEKGSDVNLAIHLIDDAADDAMDLAVVVTDDFDQEGALRMAREHYGIKLMVVSPRKRPELRRSARAEFYKPVHERLLAECQLPNPAIDHNGHELFRPPTWA